MVNDGNGARFTMDRVIVEEIDQVLNVHEWIIDSHDLGQMTLFLSSSEDESANATEAIDTNSDVGHIFSCGE